MSLKQLYYSVISHSSFLAPLFLSDSTSISRNWPRQIILQKTKVCYSVFCCLLKLVCCSWIHHVMAWVTALLCSVVEWIDHILWPNPSLWYYEQCFSEVQTMPYFSLLCPPTLSYSVIFHFSTVAISAPSNLVSCPSCPFLPFDQLTAYLTVQFQYTGTFSTWTIPDHQNCS